MLSSASIGISGVVALRVIYESEGVKYYDYSVVLIEKAELVGGDTSTEVPTTSRSASVLKVVQNALLSRKALAMGRKKKKMEPEKFLYRGERSVGRSARRELMQAPQPWEPFWASSEKYSPMVGALLATSGA